MNAELGEVRAVRDDESDTMLHVLCHAFSLDYETARPVFYQDPYFDLTHKRVLVNSEHRIVSCLTIVPALVRVGDLAVPLGGIAGVGTLPEYQRRGYAARLLSETVPTMADEFHYPLSALFPYSTHYYRRLGWEVASHTECWRGDPNALPEFEEAAHVRPVISDSRQDHESIHALYDRVYSRRTGACLRDPRRWRILELMAPGRLAALYDDDEGPAGYLMYEYLDEPDSQTLCVHEIAGVTARARRGLIGFLAAQRLRAHALEWRTSFQDLQVFGLNARSDSSHTEVPEPDVMFRVNDLPAALKLIHTAHLAPILTEESASLTLCLKDPIRTSNEAPVRLTAQGIEPGNDTDPVRLMCGIGTFVQWYLGYTLPSEAHSLGRVTASSSEALRLADRLFPRRDPFFSPMDEF